MDDEIIVLSEECVEDLVCGKRYRMIARCGEHAAAVDAPVSSIAWHDAAYRDAIRDDAMSRLRTYFARKA